MKSVILQEPGHLACADVDAPRDLPEGMALVRVHRVGVCGTDFHAWHGRQPFFTYPRVLGHELGVEVIAVRPSSAAPRQPPAPGDHCAVMPYVSCGGCSACRRGRTNCCERLQVMGVHIDGGMCELLLVPTANLYRSPTLGFETLALVETLSVGAHAVARAAPAPDDLVLVAGAGPIGLSVATFASAGGTRVAVMDVNPARLEFCRHAVPGVRTFLAADGDVTTAVRGQFDGELPTMLFDATGNRASMGRAITLAAQGATVVYVGLFQGDVTFPDPEFHRRELTLLASRNARPADFERVMAALESGRVDVQPWITHRAPLAEVPSEFSGWADPAGGVVKAMIAL